MADKKKKLTDDELADLIIEKLAVKEADIKVSEPTVRRDAYDKQGRQIGPRPGGYGSVDVEAKPPTSMVTVKNRDEDAMGRTKEEADLETKKTTKKLSDEEWANLVADKFEKMKAPKPEKQYDSFHGQTDGPEENIKEGPRPGGAKGLMSSFVTRAAGGGTGNDGTEQKQPDGYSKGQKIGQAMVAAGTRDPRLVKTSGNYGDEGPNRGGQGGGGPDFQRVGAGQARAKEVMGPDYDYSKMGGTTMGEAFKNTIGGANDAVKDTVKGAAGSVMDRLNQLDAAAKPIVMKALDAVGLLPQSMSSYEDPFNPPDRGTLTSESEIHNGPNGVASWNQQPEPPAQEQPPPAGPPPVGPSLGGGGDSMGMSIKGALGPSSIEPMPNRDPQIQAAVDAQTTAIKGSADIESAKYAADTQMFNAQSTEMAAREKRMQGEAETRATATKELFSVMADAQKVLNSPAKTPDPERYWKSHSKIMFALGVGLLAHAKGDIGAVLSNTNTAIDRDIEQQKAEFDAPRKQASAKMQGAVQLYGMLRQQGLDSYEAERMSSALMKDRYAMEAQKIAANSNNELVRTRAAEEIGKLQAGAAKDMQDADVHRQTLRVAEFNAMTNRAEFTAKISGAGKGGKGKILPATDAAGIGKLQTAADSILTLAEDFDKVSGSVGDAMVSKATGMIPRTAAHDYDKKRKAFLRTIGLLVDESVLLKHDMEDWEAILPLSGDLNGMAGLRAVQESVRLKLRDKIGAYEAAGYDVSSFARERQPQKLPPTAQRVR
jgi:hypothetical protein